MTRPLVPVLLAAALVATLSACSAGSDQDTAAPAPASASPSASATPVAPTAPSSPVPTTPAARVIAVTYAGGELSGVEQRIEVAQGEQVVLRITSDVAEEIHVHGYDLYVDVPAGGTGEVAFAADLPGAYEVELHEAGRPIFQLRVA